MKTNLRLKDDAYEIATQYASSNGVSLGDAVSILIMRGVGERVPTKVVNGITIFNVSPDLPTVTTEDILDLETEDQ
jgi:hypothetical protein